MEAWPIKALKAAPISKKIEIAQNSKNLLEKKKDCSKYEKLPKSCRTTSRKP